MRSTICGSTSTCTTPPASPRRRPPPAPRRLDPSRRRHHPAYVVADAERHVLSLLLTSITYISVLILLSRLVLSFLFHVTYGFSPYIFEGIVLLL